MLTGAFASQRVAVGIDAAALLNSTLSVRRTALQRISIGDRILEIGQFKQKGRLIVPLVSIATAVRIPPALTKV